MVREVNLADISDDLESLLIRTAKSTFFFKMYVDNAVESMHVKARQPTTTPYTGVHDGVLLPSRVDPGRGLGFPLNEDPNQSIQVQGMLRYHPFEYDHETFPLDPAATVAATSKVNATDAAPAPAPAPPRTAPTPTYPSIALHFHSTQPFNRLTCPLTYPCSYSPVLINAICLWSSFS